MADHLRIPVNQKCKHCGTAARHKGAKFCWNCGQQLPQARLNPMLAALDRADMADDPLAILLLDLVSVDSLSPQGRKVLSYTILAIREVLGEQATLADVRRFLLEQGFRDSIIEQVKDANQQQYLRDAFTTDEGEAANA